MTISTTSNTTVLQGNGLTTSFPFTFPVPVASELFVYYTDAIGNTTQLQPNQFSVTGIGTPNGGSVTYPLTGSPIASGTSIVIQRVVPLQQLTSLVNQSGYYPNVVENALDLLTMICQQIAESASLSLQVPLAPTNPNLLLPGAAGRASKVVGFDALGNAVMYPLTVSVGAGNMTVEGPFVSGVNFTPGVTTTLTLSQSYGTAANVQVHFDGVYQGNDQYTLSGTQIAFSSPIPVGTNKVYVVGGTTLSTGIPADGSVTDTKVASPTSAQNGVNSSKLSFLESGTSTVWRSVQSKLQDYYSVKGFGAAVNGATDDSTAITNARTAAGAAGNTILYGGKTYASDFWANLAPLAQEWIKGLPTAYATDVVSNHPVVGGKLFNATPTPGAGYNGYGLRFDTYTKTGVDVASTVTAMFAMQSYSTNSSGSNFNNTNQVALVANSSAMDGASSAGVEAFNAIAYSAYTGTLAQPVVAIEADVGSARAPGWFSDTNAVYGVAVSAVVNGSTNDITCAFICSGDGTHEFQYGAVLTGNKRVGLTVARDGANTPETGVWVSAATTFGIYVGAKAKWPLNPGSLANYTYKPTIGICLGQEGATSSNSHKLRLVSTDGNSTEHNLDIYSNASNALSVDFDGTNRFLFTASGTVLQSGVQILTGRQTGYTAFTGTTNTGTTYDTSSITLQQLAQRVAAIQVSLTNHGLIGA